METKQQLFDRGRERIRAFCALNRIDDPIVQVRPQRKWPYQVCAFYRPYSSDLDRPYIAICLESCASPAMAGRSWSWPGYSTDRTPYGALAHELGHHVDYHAGEVKGAYWSDFSSIVRADSGREAPLTGYLPAGPSEDAEWFAEVFRLFVTNAALLAILRPRTHGALAARFHPVSGSGWANELGANVPERYLKAVANKVRRPS